jgi:hypothetical protein
MWAYLNIKHLAEFLLVEKVSDRSCRENYNIISCQAKNYFFQYHHTSLMDFVVSPPGCGRSVTDLLGWDAHEAQLRCPDEVDGDI